MGSPSSDIIFPTRVKRAFFFSVILFLGWSRRWWLRASLSSFTLSLEVNRPFGRVSLPGVPVNVITFKCVLTILL